MIHEEYLQLKENTTHGDFMLPFVVYGARMPLNYTFFPMHWHDEVELIYVVSGSFEINLNLKNHILKEGDFVFVAPGILHAFRQYNNQDMHIITILFNMKLLGNEMLDACSIKYFTPLLEGKFKYNPIVDSSNESYNDIVDIVHNLITVYKEKNDFFELDIKYLLYKLYKDLFSSVFSLRDTKLTVKTENINHIKVVLDYIKDNYTKEITVDDLASLLNFSKSHFMRFFKNHLGITSIDYINEYRLNIATNLLITTNLTITEVAIKTGIPNISYFNRLFKKHFDMSPMHYRKKFSNNN